MPDILHAASEPTRRDVLAGLARGLLGVGLLALPPWPAWAGEPATAADPAPAVRRPAQRLIQLTMAGGMSHLDTFDPKPGTAEAGPVTALPTPVDGVLVSSYLPRLARMMDRCAIIRSLTSTQGAHEQGMYLLRTGYQLRGTIRHPCLAAWMAHVLGRANPSLPAGVGIGLGGDHPAAGFLPAGEAPLLVPAEGGLPNSALPAQISDAQFERRLRLRQAMDRRAGLDQPAVAANAERYESAVALMRSADLTAFDTAAEPAAVRAAYGEHAFGRGCLLARRLIEHGVRAVEVVLGGWDTHDDNFDRVATQAEILDAALPALLEDLAARGLLADTAVVVASEFGRTPRINERGGRDHYPKAFSALLAGGPFRAGSVHGATDATGSEVASGRMTLPDLQATLALALGLPIDRPFITPAGRPITIADKGKPVMALLG